MSPSTRRAWIEILYIFIAAAISQVALHPEGVDRNSSAALRLFRGFFVALHPEGVDRNTVKVHCGCKAEVALHPEGVDRNTLTLDPERIDRVALHPEGVDRNTPDRMLEIAEDGRPPPGGRG